MPRPTGRRPRPARPPRPAPAGPPVEVTITGVAAGGDGVARAGGLVVFVPRTAPGDVARVRLAPADRFARGALDAVVVPGPDRVEPSCPHYVADRCGGCQLQHLSYPAQLAAKRGIVADALERIGRVAADVAPPVPSPRPWRYRRKLTLALRRRGGRWVAGLHRHDAPGAVFALADCPITDERVVAVWRGVLAAAEHLPGGVAELRGAVRLLGGRESGEAPNASAALTLEGGRAWPGAGALADAVPALAAIWHVPAGGSRRLVVDRRAERLPGASFVQVNPHTATLLAAAVVEAALGFAPARAVDAYAGAGDTAAALAAAGVRVAAIELDPEAAAHAAARLAARGEVATARVEDALPTALPADVVVLNPPRGGVDPRVTDALEAAARGRFGPPPAGLVYVSCNPATLARDLARLPSYRVRTVRPFDMFPQTAHVETLVVLDRATPEAAPA